MNDETILKYLAMSGNRQMHDYLEERLSPAGEHLRLVGEHAKRADRHGATTDQGHSLRVGRTKGGSELQRLVERWKKKESDFREQAEEARADRDWTHEIGWDLKADEVKRYREELEAALLSETQPQSVAEDVQRCGECRTPLEDDGEVISCPECFEIMDDSPRDDVSGACLPNSDIKES